MSGGRIRAINDRSLIWSIDPPSPRELRSDGYTVVNFREVRAQHIERARTASPQRISLDNAAASLMRLLDENPKLAVLGVPSGTAGDLRDIYSFLVEPAFRRDVTLLIGVDRPLEDLRPSQFVAPEFGYPWTLERLAYIADRYQRRPTADGLPPLTPIEERLFRAMREADLTPEVQFGIGPYRADFAFPDQRLVIEADGRAWHDAERDAARDEHLRLLGWVTLRFSGSEIHRSVGDIVERIAGSLEERAALVTYSELSSEPVPKSWWRRLLDWLLRRSREEIDPWSQIPVSDVSRPVPRWKSGLDADQLRAVDSHEGVVQIIAPAGSGKTTTMITRVQELLSRGVPANRILCTTFNRATRDELEQRLAERGINGADVRNFHALGRMILADEKCLRSDIGMVSYAQWRRIAKRAMDSLEDGVWLDAPAASEVVSNFKLGLMWDPATAAAKAADPMSRTAAVIYAMYEEHLAETDRHDFDDLILRAIELLRSDEHARRRWQNRWECVLVDEYQDIEPAQELLIQMIAAPEDSLFVVGDEDQCIYSWRRASVERTVMLDTVYPGLKRVVLSTSYRCPARITEAARSLITNNKRRFPKSILSSPVAANEGEIELIAAESLPVGAEQVAARLGAAQAPDEVVVLARTSRLLRELVQACVKLGIPIRAPARASRPSDAEETVLAYLRLVTAPQAATAADVRQSFRVPNRYLPRDGEAIVAGALHAGRAFDQAIDSLKVPGSESWRTDKLHEWASLCAELAGTSDAATAVRILRTRGGLDRHYSSVEQMSPHDQIEVETLDDLENSGKGGSIAELVTKLEQRAAGLANINDEKGIELTTIHGAKGREWRTVILFGANADQLPHYRTLLEAEDDEKFEQAIEDERRLMYVAVTRSKEKLIVVTTNGKPSPFIREAGLPAGTGPLPTRAAIQASLERANKEGSEGHSRPNSRQRSGPTKARPASSDQPTTTARYPGKCSACGRSIREGETIVRVKEAWVHQACASR